MQVDISRIGRRGFMRDRRRYRIIMGIVGNRTIAVRTVRVNTLLELRIGQSAVAKRLDGLQR